MCRLRHAHSGSPNFLLKTKTPFIQRSVAPTNCAFPIFVRMNTTYMCTYKHTCTLLQKGTSCENFDPVLCEHSCKHCLMFTSIYETIKGSRRSLSIVFVFQKFVCCPAEDLNSSNRPLFTQLAPSDYKLTGHGTPVSLCLWRHHHRWSCHRLLTNNHVLKTNKNWGHCSKENPPAPSQDTCVPAITTLLSRVR